MCRSSSSEAISASISNRSATREGIRLASHIIFQCACSYQRIDQDREEIEGRQELELDLTVSEGRGKLFFESLNRFSTIKETLLILGRLPYFVQAVFLSQRWIIDNVILIEHYSVRYWSTSICNRLVKRFSWGLKPDLKYDPINACYIVTRSKMKYW